MTATISSGPGTREHEAGLHETFSNSSCHPQLQAGEGRELQMVRLRLLQLPSPAPCQTGKAQGFNSPQTTHLFPGKLKLKAQTVFCLRMPHFKPLGQRIVSERVIGQDGPYVNKGVAPASRSSQHPTSCPNSLHPGADQDGTTFYHHWPEPVTEKSGSMEQSQWWGWKGLSAGLTLLVLALFVGLIVFAVRANSKACKEGLLAEQECRNVTCLLEHQLAQTRQHLLGAKDEAATCNQTVVRDRPLRVARPPQV